MTSSPEEPLTVAFVGYADPAMSERAAAYEDEVLPLLDHHGARVLYRGRRAGGEDPALPLEVHLLWFPNRRALASYMADDRRQALLQEFGEVFTLKHAVAMDTISSAFHADRSG